MMKSLNTPTAQLVGGLLLGAAVFAAFNLISRTVEAQRREIGIGMALGVVATMAASVTLLPAVLGFVGRNIDRLRVPFTGRASHQGTHAFWYRWSRVVQRRP
jgi:RND superfamily putative drug exporter